MEMLVGDNRMGKMESQKPTPSPATKPETNGKSVSVARQHFLPFAS